MPNIVFGRRGFTPFASHSNIMPAFHNGYEPVNDMGGGRSTMVPVMPRSFAPVATPTGLKNHPLSTLVDAIFHPVSIGSQPAPFQPYEPNRFQGFHPDMSVY